jgi:squalene-hopene/tetraprenyl-beta-curcumene cyclase
MIDTRELAASLDRVVAELRAARVVGPSGEAGHWVGELSTSALSTATAVSALAVVERSRGASESSSTTPSARHGLILRGLKWLWEHQNRDGGWGDTDKSYSNIATTMLVRAAFHLTGVPAKHRDLLDRAAAFIDAQGGVAGLKRRYGKDKTFAVPILTNAALAGLVDWRSVSPLPFELACLPQSAYRFLRLPVVSYAIPALVAIGQARFHHAPPRNPILRWIRSAALGKSLKVVEAMQPQSGGFLEATPLTSFVVMSLASIGHAEHPIVERGVKFLVESVRPDGSWPIDANLATWNTTLAINALWSAGERAFDPSCLDWLLKCQHRNTHRYTGAAPGGWAWTDLSGGVPDVDDTSGALLALAASHCDADEDGRERIDSAALAGVRWLLELQNRDGGWPTFCRGWGALPFDRSGADLTAHAVRALFGWRGLMAAEGRRKDSPPTVSPPTVSPPTIAEPAVGDLAGRIERAIERGLAYLYRNQRADGSWTPLWFGNQDHADEENPVYGTARVLMAYRDLGKLDSWPARRGVEYLAQSQNSDGGWGNAGRTERATAGVASSVEETALAVEALGAVDSASESLQNKVQQGLKWLMGAIEENRHYCPSPIGFYFARLWYYEQLYPLTFAVSALGQAARRRPPRPEPRPTHAPLRRSLPTR